MSTPLNIIVIKKSEDDAALVRRTLEKADFTVNQLRVETIDQLKAALVKGGWDLVISDDNLTDFNTATALTLVKSTGDDIPFIIVSSKVDEEAAIELMRIGAADYLLKDKLARLELVVKRELLEAQIRHERRETEIALVESNRRFRTLFDQSPFGVVIFDPLSMLPIEFNAIAYQQLGYTREEFARLRIPDYEVNQKLEDIARHISTVLNKGKEEFDSLHRTKNGDIRSIHITALPLALIDRTVLHCVFQDITERIHAESALKESKVAFQDIFQSVNEGIAYTSLSGEVLSINNALSDILNVPKEEIVGRNIVNIAKNLLSFKMATQVVPKLLNMIKGNGVEPFEVEYKDKTLEVNSLYNKNSRHITGVIRDITERKQAEKVLQESETRLQAMVTNISDVIAIMKLDGKISYKSPNVEKWFGWKPDDLVGKDGWQTVHPDDLEQVQSVFNKLLQKDGNTETIEYHYKCKNNSYRLINLTATNLIKDPVINGILLNYHDVTEQRKAEEKFRKVFFTSPDSITINRLDDGLFIEINKGFTDMFGYKYEEAIGKTSSEINIWANPDDRVRLTDKLRENGKVINFEAPFRKKDKTIITCLMTSNIIEINGETCILHLVRDITDLKKAEEAIQLQSAALNIVANAVVISDASTYNIKWANPAFCKLSGYSIEEIVGRNLSDLVRSGEHDQTVYENLWQTIINGNVWQGEITNRRKNGEIYPEFMTITPLIDQDGIITNFISIKQDISEKKLTSDIMNSRVHLLEYSVNHNLEDLLKETLREAENLTGSLIGFYHFLDADQQTISLQALSTRTIEDFCATEGSGLHYPINKASVWFDCIRERRPVIHNDFAALPNHKDMPAGHASVIRELVVPVLRDNKIVALLGVGNKTNEYSNKDVEIVARLADLTWDIAEKKKSDQALLESEQHYRDIVTDLDKAQFYAHLGSWTWDIQNNQLTWSDEMFRIFGLNRSTFSGKLEDVINQSIHPEDRQKVDEANRAVTIEGNPIPLEYRIIRSDQTVRTVWGEAGELLKDKQGKPVQLSGIVQDITERKAIEERVKAERELLHLCNQAENVESLSAGITTYLKQFTNCDAVGMRLHQRDDFPYYETNGFPISFIEKERSLFAAKTKKIELQERRGDPILECICGMVLQERINLNKPYFTPNGSFWTNSTTELQADLKGNYKNEHIRNRCNNAGYESVALIPIRLNTRMFGLFQFNDQRKGHFTSKQIELLEHLANFVAIALAKLESDEALIESEKRYKNLFEHAAIPNLEEDFSEIGEIFNKLRQQGVTDMRSYFENHPELVVQCAQQIRVLDVNQACVEFFKVNSKEELFTQLPEFFTELSWSVFREEIITLAEGKSRFESDISARIKTGEEREINLILLVDPEHSDTLSRVMVSFIDVTESRKAQEALRESEILLRESQAIAGMGSYVLDISTGIWKSSEVLDKLFGIDKTYDKTIAGWVSLIHPADSKMMSDHFRNTVIGLGQNFNKEYRIIRQDNRDVRWVYGVGMLEFDAQGNILKMRGMIQDITEHKLAEEALRKNEALLKEAQQLSKIGAWEWDVTSQTLNWTDEVYRIHGMSPEETSEKSHDLVQRSLACYDPQDRPIISAAFERCVASGIPYELELRFTSEAGEHKWVRTLAKSFLENGEVVRVAGNIMDITASKLAEEKLQENANQYHSMISTTMDGFFICDTQGKIKDLNETFSQMLGYSRDEILQFSLADFEAIETPAETKVHIESIKQSGSDRFETHYRRKDGTLLNVENNANFMKERGVFLVFVRDITARKKAEEALLESEARFRSLFQNVQTVAVQGYGADGTTQYWNKASEKLFGYSQQEAIGKKLFDLIVPPEMHHEVEQDFKLMNITRIPIPSSELSLMRKDGSRVSVYSSHALVGKPNQSMELFCIDVDLTEHKTMEMALQTSLDEKEVLLREVHHRVKNNLASILGLLEMERQSTTNPSADALLIELGNRIKSMATIHEKLYRSPSLAKIDFQDYLKSFISHLRTSMHPSGDVATRVEAFNVELSLDLAVPCGLIVNELVTNSLKYAFPQGKPGIPGTKKCEICVSMSVHNTAHTLTVADNGVGMPKDLDWRNAKSLGLRLITMLGEHQLGGKIILDRTGGTKFTLKFDPRHRK